MGSLATVGLAIIARDEAGRIGRLLTSIEGAFDRVVLLDTGSTDDTKAVFQKWAGAQAGVTFSVGDFEWIDDFAAARNAADELLLWGTWGTPLGEQVLDRPYVDWTCWADCDDELVGAEHLRRIATDAADHINHFLFGYDYVQHPDTGACVCHLKRERLVRAGQGHWVTPVHECQGPSETATFWRGQYVPDEVCHWRHRKLAENPETAGLSNARNLRILSKWAEREPTNQRVLAYMGRETILQGQWETALEWFRRYEAVKGGWDDERAQCHRYMAQALQQLDRLEEAEHTALQGIVAAPSWPDNYTTLAELALDRGEWTKAIEWAKRVLDIGVPDTLLIVNPLEYTAGPRRIIAFASAQLGDFDTAVTLAGEALELHAADEALHAHWFAWRATRKREKTADTYVMMGEQLVAHDEQIKALELLERCVPAFAYDHPRIVALRSFVRERLLWTTKPAAFVDHYQTGGSKPEDFHSDEESDRIAGLLPRVEYLLEGLDDQAPAPEPIAA